MRNIHELGVNVRVKKDLPYTPYPDEIIFVDGAHTIKIERWRIDYYKDFICGILNVPEGYAESYGELIIEMLNRPEFWEFFSDEERQEIESELVDKFNFRQYLLPQVLADNLRPSLFIYDGDDATGYHQFIQFEVDRNGLISTLNDVLLYMDSRDKMAAMLFERESAIDAERSDVIASLRSQIKQLEAYISECETKLMKMGMNRKDIKDAMSTDSEEVGLYISKLGKFYITKNCNPTEQEIRLSPLDKAVYMLFLRHPEGINFSYLPDYREELLEIYRSLMNYRTTASMQKSVEDVTDSTNNSINEKCARIRRAFVTALGQYKANAFIIAGPRGEAKKIGLDRRFVYQEK